MLDSNRVNPCVLTRRQIQMLWFQKPLVDESLLHVLLVKSLLTLVFEQVLVQVLHHAVFNTLPVELIHLLGVLVLRWRIQGVEFLLHVVHEFLYVLALLLAIDVSLDQLWKHVLDKRFDFFTDWECFITLELVVEVMEDALLLLLLLWLLGRRSLLARILILHI